jgi:ariadne-1
MAWCPGVDCKYCVLADRFSKDIYCKCGFVFCFKCRDEVHVPTPCDMVSRWLLEVKKDEANIRWIMVNTKMCPFCKKNVERSEGCNFMSCKPPGGCGNSFCYVCS